MTPSANELVVRAAALYFPIVLLLAAGLWQRPSRRVIAAAVAGTAWNIVALLALNAAALNVGWWNFAEVSGALHGVPVDLWLGWALLWGAVPVLALPHRPSVAGALLVAFDLLLMPLGEPVVTLGPTWLIGELVGVVGCLAPGLLLARLTMRAERPTWRAGLQAVTFTGLLLWVLPSAIFTITGGGWSTLLDRPRWQLVIVALAMTPPAAMALQAVSEFATVGNGTPVPLDPPDRLVVTGPYAYVANPMQLGGTLVLAIWAAALGSWAVLAAAAMAAIFSAGIAAFTEHHELADRFGAQWADYRRNVRLWLPRFRPWLAPRDQPIGRAIVWVGSTCGPCSEIERFLRMRHLTDLEIRAAEESPIALNRLTYEDASTRQVGIAGLARSLEHSHLGWAMASWIVRLPVVLPVLQLTADAAGAGPRSLEQLHHHPPCSDHHHAR